MSDLDCSDSRRQVYTRVRPYQPQPCPPSTTFYCPPYTAPHSDRNSNVVISKKGTPRVAEDLESITATLTKIDSTINDYTIRDCYRLGKYSENARSPRPILAIFNRSIDASKVLSRRSSLPPPFIIKPTRSHLTQTKMAFKSSQASSSQI